MQINLENKPKTNNEIGQFYSFDIFDTLVTRRVAESKGIFAIMQNVLTNKFDNIIRHNFCTIRMHVEKLAREIANHRINTNEVTLDEIYAVLQNSYGLSNEETSFLKQLEIDTEIKNLVPIHKNISLLKDFVSLGRDNVVLISDMYFSVKDLRHILRHIDPIFENIKIYVSSEYRASKAEGSLYNIVQKEFGVDFSNWTHWGDNEFSDINKAKVLGINAIHLRQEPLMPYEEKLLKLHPDNAYFQVIAGSARLARLNKVEINQDAYNFGTSFAAPILYSYVDWIIGRSLKQGFKTLYFIARDGYMPKLIADTIIEKRKLDIKTKYLYGSRAAWRIPSEDNFDVFIDCVFEECGYHDPTVEFLKQRFDSMAGPLEEVFGKIPENKKINRKTMRTLIEKIKNNRQLKNKMLELNNERKNLLLGYLKQEIDFSEKNIAFVDLHGSGRTQDFIATCLNEITPCVVWSFYLADANFSMKQSNESIKVSYPYLSDQKCDPGWIELLCRATHGQTLGYKTVDDRIEAILEETNSQKIIKWGFNEYIDGLRAYTSAMIDTETSNNSEYSTIGLYHEYFDYIHNSLDRETALIMGKIPFTSIGSEQNMPEVAPPLSTLKLLSDFLLCKKRTQPCFPYISLARSSELSKRLYEFMVEFPTIREYLFSSKVLRFFIEIHIHRKAGQAYIRILGVKISFAHLLWR